VECHTLGEKKNSHAPVSGRALRMLIEDERGVIRASETLFAE